MTNFANKYATRLAAYLDDDATSCTVESVTGDPAVPYNAIIGRKGAFPDEIVTVTNVTGSVLTITRATEAVAGVQTAYDHPVGATFTAILTAGAMTTAFAGTAISDLDAVTAPAATDEFVVNQGGTSKKVTLAQVATAVPGAVLDHVTLSPALGYILIASVTTEGTATTVVTGNAITFDGTTKVRVTFFTPAISPPAGVYATLVLLDGATVVGWLGYSGTGISGTGNRTPFYAEYVVTPTAGSHQYKVAAFGSGAGNTYIAGDVGGSGKPIAGFLRVTRV